MSGYYRALARAKLLKRSAAFERCCRLMAGMPGLCRIEDAGKRLFAQVLLPRTPRWVKVETGLAQGLWLRLNLSVEGNYWLGDYEVRVQDLLGVLCVPGSVFFDIGANLGFFSLAVANAVGPRGKVVAFEPEPENYARLREMAVRNNLQARIVTMETAVWSRTEQKGVPFRRGGRQATYGGVSSDGVTPVLAEGEMLRVTAVSLDDFLRQGNRAPDVLKVNVEGGECEVLKGCEELFSRVRPALICEVHRAEAASWIASWLSTKEYVARWQVPEELYPRLLFAQPAVPSRNRRDSDHE